MHPDTKILRIECSNLSYLFPQKWKKKKTALLFTSYLPFQHKSSDSIHSFIPHLLSSLLLQAQLQ